MDTIKSQLHELTLRINGFDSGAGKENTTPVEKFPPLISNSPVIVSIEPQHAEPRSERQRRVLLIQYASFVFLNLLTDICSYV